MHPRFDQADYAKRVDPILTTAIILLLAIAAFVSNRIPLGVIAVGVALSLFFTGILTLPEAIAGFGDPTVIFIAALFVVSESLDATGITAWAGQRVVARAGTRYRPLLVLISLLVAVFSALITPTGAVAAFLPLVVVVAARASIPASQLLMPLAFVGHAGSMLLLTGTAVNIIVSEAAVENGGHAFGYAEFALVGIPLVIGTMLIILLFGRRLLPNRKGAALPLDLARYSRTLSDQYAVDLDPSETLGPKQGIIEVVIAPRSPLIGVKFNPGMATPSGDLVLLAARRGDKRMPEGFTAEEGDSLLLQGSWDDLDTHAHDGRVLPVKEPEALRRSVPLGAGAKRAMIILAIMVVLLATGIVPPAAAALLAAAALVLSRVLSPEQAYASISWTTVVLIAGMFPLSTAFVKTGMADLIAHHILSFTGGASPYLALFIICAITIVLGQFISNVATVLLIVPVAAAIANTLGLSVMPFMMALTVAGAASFLTPIATPANLMVFEPGGYRFGDYWKLGVPLAALFLAVAVFLVPTIWPFAR